MVVLGILPSTDLAEASGLKKDDGIVADAPARTSDPDIYAAGDCAIAQYDGQMARLESVPTVDGAFRLVVRG